MHRIETPIIPPEQLDVLEDFARTAAEPLRDLLLQMSALARDTRDFRVTHIHRPGTPENDHLAREAAMDEISDVL